MQLHFSIISNASNKRLSFASLQKKKMIQGEEQEVSSFSTLTETDDFALSSNNKSYLDCRQDREYGMSLSILVLIFSLVNGIGCEF